MLKDIKIYNILGLWEAAKNSCSNLFISASCLTGSINPQRTWKWVSAMTLSYHNAFSINLCVKSETETSPHLCSQSAQIVFTFVNNPISDYHLETVRLIWSQTDLPGPQVHLCAPVVPACWYYQPQRVTRAVLLPLSHTHNFTSWLPYDCNSITHSNKSTLCMCTKLLTHIILHVFTDTYMQFQSSPSWPSSLSYSAC